MSITIVAWQVAFIGFWAGLGTYAGYWVAKTLIDFALSCCKQPAMRFTREIVLGEFDKTAEASLSREPSAARDALRKNFRVRQP